MKSWIIAFLYWCQQLWINKWNSYLIDQLAGSTLRQSEIYALISPDYSLSLLTSSWEFHLIEFEIYIVSKLLVVVSLKTILKSHNHKVKGYFKWSRSLITFSTWIFVKCARICILNYFCLAILCLWEVEGMSYVGHSFTSSVFVYIKTDSAWFILQ